jgi:hypothetical protein
MRIRTDGLRPRLNPNNQQPVQRGTSMRAIYFGPRTFMSVAMAALLCYAPAVSADEGEMERHNSLIAGSWSLQFRITDDFQLSSFQGATVSAKRHLSDGRAIRFGASLSGSFTDEEHRSIDESADSTTFEYTTDENQQYVRFDVQYMIYPSPMKKLNVFFGVGPLFELSRGETSGLGQWRLNKIWRFGLSGVLGVEWFATKRISFISEYSSSLTYDYLTTERTFSIGDSSNYRNEDERQTLSFSYKSIRFGLSLYL